MAPAASPLLTFKNVRLQGEVRATFTIAQMNLSLIRQEGQQRNLLVFLKLRSQWNRGRYKYSLAFVQCS